jgi:hypothetical protein
MKTVLSIDGWRGKRVVRQAPKGRIHDRFIVGDHGIHILGTSLNGVGKSTTTLLIPLPSEVESAVRGELEKTWEMATELACTPVAPATTPSTEQREEPRSSTQDNYAEDENRRSARKKPAAKKTTSRRAPRPKPSKSPE